MNNFRFDSRAEITTPNQRFEFLDGLRGLAAVLVVFFHLNDSIKNHSLPSLPSFLDFIFNQGHFGVQIFFVLSGFVIAYSIRNATISLRFIFQFFIRRSVRLDPPYWVVICLLIALSLLGNGIFAKMPVAIPSFSEILINFFYLPNLLNRTSLLPVAWTLCIEIQFYIFFLAFIKIIQLLDKQFSVFQGHHSPLSLPSLLLLSFLLIVSLLQNTSYALFPPLPGFFLSYWYSFFIGNVLCWLMLDRIKPTFFWINFGFIICYAILTKQPMALQTGLVTLSIFLVLKKEGMHRCLSSWFFQYTGKISYSLYLTHWMTGVKGMDVAFRFFSSYFTTIWSSYILIGMMFLFSLLVADIFYRLIEYPSLRLSHKLKSKKLLQSIAVN